MPYTHTDEPTRTGLSTFATLTIIFVVLKLTGLVAWSWWWVLAPVWMPPALAISVGLVVVGGLSLLSWIVTRLDL